jgi:putative ABC transport system permease protein
VTILASIKRAFLSMIHNWKGTLLFIAIMTSVFTVITISIQIYSGAENYSELLGKTILTDITLQAESISDENMIKYDEAKQYASNPDVSSYQLMLSAYVTAYDFSPVFTSSSQSDNDVNVLIIGITDSSTMDTFSDGSRKIIEGDGIDAGSTKSALIDSLLAVRDKLSVGDEITVINSDQVKETCVIKGIYDTKEQEMDPDPSRSTPNRIYVDETTASELNKGLVVTAKYKVDNTSDIQQQKQRILAAFSNSDRLNITIDNSEYRALKAPVKRLINISEISAAAVLLFGTIIITLESVLTLKLRDTEIGILLAMGESRKKIVLQFLLELSANVIVGIVISSVLSICFSQNISSFINNSEIKIRLEAPQIFALIIVSLIMIAISIIIIIRKVVAYNPKELIIQMV